jgi:hypothetical protein
MSGAKAWNPTPEYLEHVCISTITMPPTETEDPMVDRHLNLNDEQFLQEFRALKRYSRQCESVTEFGTYQCCSTWALLAGRPKRLTTYDIGITSHPAEGHVGAVESEVNRLAAAAPEYGTEFKFVLGNTLEVVIEPTDMLFIDSCHRYVQLTKELELHADKVKKFLAFHDTTVFGNTDEYREPSPESRGLWPAIVELMASKPWDLKERLHTRNGLTVLERKA